MRKHFGPALVSLSVLAHCGGSSQKAPPATAATSESASHLSIAAGMEGDEPYDVTGPAFAQYLPGRKMLGIYVVDPASQPAPSCASIGPAGMLAFKSGGSASVGLANFTGGPQTGTFPVMQAGYMKGDVAKQQFHAGGALPNDTKLVISAYDAKHLEAEVKGPDGKTLGTLHAQVCPDDTNDAQMRQQLQQAAANTPQPGEPNAIDITFADKKHQVTAGPGALVKLDPKSKTLDVYVWDDFFQPVPTCDAFADAAKNAQQGGLAFVGAEKFPARKTGTFPLAGGQFFTTGLDPSQEAYGAGLFDATTIEIKQFDDGAFVAKISSAPDAKTQVSGRINASVCADGPVVFPAAKGQTKAKPTKQGKGGAKKK